MGIKEVAMVGRLESNVQTYGYIVKEHLAQIQLRKKAYKQAKLSSGYRREERDIQSQPKYHSKICLVELYCTCHYYHLDLIAIILIFIIIVIE